MLWTFLCLLLLAVLLDLSSLHLDLGWQATAASISALIAKKILFPPLAFFMALAMQFEKSVTMWSGFAGMFTDAGGILHVGAMCCYLHSIYTTHLASLQ